MQGARYHRLNRGTRAKGRVDSLGPCPMGSFLAQMLSEEAHHPPLVLLGGGLPAAGVGGTRHHPQLPGLAGGGQQGLALAGAQHLVEFIIDEQKGTRAELADRFQRRDGRQVNVKPPFDHPAGQGCQGEGWQVEEVAQPVPGQVTEAGEGALRHYCPRLRGRRSGHEGGGGPQRDPQHPDARGVHLGPATQVVQSPQQVQGLVNAHRDGLTLALASVTEVEQEDGEAGSMEEVGVGE
ncbi:MAG: hypothetical protein OEW93_11030 [Candidatus Bathyarchaeota archaeon]|nr:hypothetical protein [Candidatus Bathyarchaeota archaeon]